MLPKLMVEQTPSTNPSCLASAQLLDLNTLSRINEASRQKKDTPSVTKSLGHCNHPITES
jgi:hypothetical protein